MKKIYALFICTASLFQAFAAEYFVSPLGLDTNPGTITLPFKTITKAVSSATAGDIIYLRGGTHSYATRINISKSGTSASRLKLYAYPGDPRPVIDFSAMAVNSSNRGLDIGGSYWHFKGFDVFKAGDNGMHVDGSNNIIEFCAFYENADSGLQLDNGAANNLILNCDSYFNKDASDGNADGFAAKLNVGTGNKFKGCRAWQNSDDGWDGLLSTGFTGNPYTTYDSCWCFMNGYLKSGVASVGNGNGFKVGGNNTLHDVLLTNCIAAYNRVKGFDQNNNNGSMILYNCTGYANRPNFGMNNNDPSSGKVMIVKNCVSFGGLSSDAFRSVCVRTNNSWQLTSPSVTSADFITLDSTGLRNPRNVDGSLPILTFNFMRPSASSRLINAGTDVGLPFNGSAPDVGAYETAAPLPISLNKFIAIQQQQHVILQWTTATEQNNKGWLIERSVPGSNNWTKLGFVAGAVTSNSLQQYQFVDKEVFNTCTAFLYRLAQQDIDGKTTYSKQVLVNCNKANFMAVTAFPNPVTDITTLKMHLPSDTEIALQLFDATGHFVANISGGFKAAGSYSIPVTMGYLSSGFYTVVLRTATDKITTTIIKK
jgi:hypothetical protein